MPQFEPCFSDLPDELVIEIFNNLKTKKLLSIERVSRTWKRCVDELLNRVEILAFHPTYLWNYDPNRCQHLRFINHTRTLAVPDSCSLISSGQLDSMLPVLKRCKQIKCLWLDTKGWFRGFDNRNYYDYYDNSTCFWYTVVFDDIETFGKLLDVLPQLECLYHGHLKFKNRFNKSEWLSVCQKIGPQITHLTIDRIEFWPKQIFENLIAASPGLEFVYFNSIGYDDAMIHYLKLLQNRESINHLAIEFHEIYDREGQFDVDTATVFSRATSITTRLAYLYPVARYCPNFDRLKTLDVTCYAGDLTEHWVLNFPVLEHLVCKFVDFDQPTIINYIEIFNLSGLKSLKINLNNNLLKALAGKIPCLKKLVSKSSCDELPTDSLLLLKSIEYLSVIHWIKNVDHLNNVGPLFEVLAQMLWLKRCRVKIEAYDYFCIKWIRTNLIYQLTQAESDLRIR